MRTTTALVLLFALLGGGGCAAGVAEPTATVTSIALVDQSANAARVRFTVELKNDNTVPLPMVEANYRVTVDGIGSFSFTDMPNKAIPARRTDIDGGPASQVISLLAAFATGGKDVKGLNCKVSGSVVYEPPGEIRKLLTDSAVPLPSAGFSGEGKLE